MNPAVGLADLRARYGALELESDSEGGYRISSPAGWESDNMTLLRDLPGMPDHKLYVNRAIAAPLVAALSSALSVCPDYAIRTIGCWNPRYKRTAGGDISVHAWGLAVDINAATNPMRSPLTTDMPDAFIEAFTAQGFTWGGTFPTPDAMHYQFCSQY